MTSTAAANQINSLQTRGFVRALSKPRQHAVKAKCTHRMPAGKAVRVRRHAKVCRGPRAMVDVFERQVEHERARHSHYQPESCAPPSQFGEDAKRNYQLND